MSKLIGIVGTRLGNSPRLGVDQRYVDYFRQFGNVIVLDSDQNELLPLNMLVLPGGADVNTFRYGQAPILECDSFNNQLDRFDTVVLPEYIKKEVPIFGICRGMQTLNVLFGGTLTQNFCTPISSDEGEDVHPVLLEETNQFIPSGSNHHQCVNQVPDCFIPIMRSYEYAAGGRKENKPDIAAPLNIEGFKHIDLPIIAVQMHPEKSYDSGNCHELVGYCNKLVKQILL